MHNLTFTLRTISSACLIGLVAVPFSLAAQETQDVPRKTRIALGPQLVPSYPGSDQVAIRPLVDFSRSKDGEEFEFEAPDESFGFQIYRKNDFSFGPAVGLEGKRSSSELDGTLPKVPFTVELGAFVQYKVSERFRLRTEIRRGVNGHDGFVGIVGADYVMRDGDKQLLSIGPRVTITNQNYQQAYFGITPEDSVPSGVPAYNPSGGVQAVGGTIGYIQQFTPRWGIYSYAKYDRLVGDPGDSPVVSQFGSRDQFSGGIALTYTLGEAVN